MTVAEACLVLGVSPGYTLNKVKEKHREMIPRLHSDVGGSKFLCQKINEAGDLLLKE